MLSRPRPAGEAGFVMPVLMGVLLAVTLLSVAALAAAQGDLLPGADDAEDRRAYAVAEAGIQDYAYHLLADNAYWRQCADPRNPSLNLQEPGTPANTAARRWASLPGSSGRFSVEVLGRGATPCSTANPEGTVLQPDGTLRIRSTGQARADDAATRRSLVATFRRTGFLDYLYFTDFETSDPLLAVIDTEGKPTRDEDAPNPDFVTWAKSHCTKHWRSGRGDELFLGWGSDGSRYSGGRNGVNGIYETRDGTTAWYSWANRCAEIQFFSDAKGTDGVFGPMHTNDEILVCGSPTFGRSPADVIEVGGPGSGKSGDGWRSNGCSGTAPRVNFPGKPVNPTLGTWRKNAKEVKMPPSNRALRPKAAAAYRFVGRTEIELKGARMTVTGRTESEAAVTTRTVDLPANGVVYVSNGTCGVEYAPLNPGSEPAGCGTVELRGEYARDLTIAAENDVVVEGDVRRQSGQDVLLGIVANNWIRVAHPVKGTPTGTSCENAEASGTRTIEAALLALNHSFTVDRYFCGARIGTLRVFGAIAQRFRGPVGRGESGYYKDYEYDDRLRTRTPPFFIDPVQSAWRMTTFVEQVPAQRP